MNIYFWNKFSFIKFSIIQKRISTKTNRPICHSNNHLRFPIRYYWFAAVVLVCPLVLIMAPSIFQQNAAASFSIDGIGKTWMSIDTNASWSFCPSNNHQWILMTSKTNLLWLEARCRRKNPEIVFFSSVFQISSLRAEFDHTNATSQPTIIHPRDS